MTLHSYLLYLHMCNIWIGENINSNLVFIFTVCLNDIFRHLVFDKSLSYHWDVEKVWQQNTCSYILYCVISVRDTHNMPEQDDFWEPRCSLQVLLPTECLTTLWIPYSRIMWSVNNYSANHISSILWNQKAHYHICSSPLSILIPGQMNVVYHTKSVYLRSLISLFHLCLGFPNGLFLSRFHFSDLYVYSAMPDTHPFHLTLISILEDKATMSRDVGIQFTYWCSVICQKNGNSELCHC